MSARELKVEPSESGARLDAFVSRSLGFSRAKVKALFEEGAIRVDGRLAKKGQTVSGGQLVAVKVEEVSGALVPEPDAPLVVLHVDDALVFIDKPAGFPSHPLKPGEVGTVANALIARYPECETASDDGREGGLCHRLDVGTSGVLLAARSKEAWRAMREAFTARRVDKRYWAVVTGPIADEGEIDLPLRHHARHADRVQPAADGAGDAREAFTSFRVLSRAGEASLVEAQIETGVLHQVRAHLAAIGAPIWGDELYGGLAQPGLGRFFLHARALGIRHPISDQDVRVTSPLPPELAQVLNNLGLGAP